MVKAEMARCTKKYFIICEYSSFDEHWLGTEWLAS